MNGVLGIPTRSRWSAAFRFELPPIISIRSNPITICIFNTASTHRLYINKIIHLLLLIFIQTKIRTAIPSLIDVKKRGIIQGNHIWLFSTQQCCVTTFPDKEINQVYSQHICWVYLTVFFGKVSLLNAHSISLKCTFRYFMSPEMRSPFNFLKGGMPTHKSSR